MPNRKQDRRSLKLPLEAELTLARVQHFDEAKRRNSKSPRTTLGRARETAKLLVVGYLK
jgi:hypothetical protein